MFVSRSKATRFRWIQPGTVNAEDSWALTTVYIGDECDCSCAGHGRCDHARCMLVSMLREVQLMEMKHLAS